MTPAALAVDGLEERLATTAAGAGGDGELPIPSSSGRRGGEPDERHDNEKGLRRSQGEELEPYVVYGMSPVHSASVLSGLEQAGVGGGGAGGEGGEGAPPGGGGNKGVDGEDEFGRGVLRSVSFEDSVAAQQLERYPTISSPRVLSMIRGRVSDNGSGRAADAKLATCHLTSVFSTHRLAPPP